MELYVVVIWKLTNTFIWRTQYLPLTGIHNKTVICWVTSLVGIILFELGDTLKKVAILFGSQCVCEWARGEPQATSKVFMQVCSKCEIQAKPTKFECNTVVSYYKYIWSIGKLINVYYHELSNKGNEKKLKNDWLKSNNKWSKLIMNPIRIYCRRLVSNTNPLAEGEVYYDDYIVVYFRPEFLHANSGKCHLDELLEDFVLFEQGQLTAHEVQQSNSIA